MASFCVEWHHFVLSIKKNGELRIWIDGKTADEFKRDIEPFNRIEVSGRDGFRLGAELDELAFYNTALDPRMIRQHVMQFKKGEAYTFSLNKSMVNEAAESFILKPATIDTLEYAPGYPDCTIQGVAQLKEFSDPRYSRTMKMMRNFPWLDIRYLHRELPGKGGKGFGKLSPDRAVDMVEEMSKRWNYFVELPCLRLDSVSANKRYADPSSVEFSLIRFANQHPQLPTASVIMEVQGKPVHAGFPWNSAYQSAQNLEGRYYLKDAKGKPIIFSNKKWLSPLAPLDIIQYDARTTAFYLRQLAKHLNKPIDMLNENGEIFGHMRPKELLEKDVEVKKDIESRKLTVPQYNGWFQNRLDTCYKNEILRSLGWKNTLFTFYNVSAYNSAYWPDYAMRRTSNFSMKGNHYSTPSFYPSKPDNWRRASGPLNGYGTVAEGRLKEIKLGDKLFAPFVSAGWGLEENNIRPAQWLALLKSMVMLGADFFHVGYFNVTGRAGWPNRIGPNDPRGYIYQVARGYIYQVAMPAYAQAIASRVQNFILDGELLNPQEDLASNIYTFRFKGNKENHLILVRRLKDKYLIYGSIQPNSNIKGNIPQFENTEIILNGKKIKFEIRRQGSMYILDVSNDPPVFYQLDSWHQYEHPYFWKKSFFVEAENFDKGDNGIAIITEGKPFLYDQYISYVKISSDQKIRYNVPDPEKYSSINLNCKKIYGSPSIFVRSGSFKTEVNVDAKDWENLVLNINANSLSEEWQLVVTGGIIGLNAIEWINR